MYTYKYIWLCVKYMQQNIFLGMFYSKQCMGMREMYNLKEIMHLLHIWDVPNLFILCM